MGCLNVKFRNIIEEESSSFEKGIASVINKHSKRVKLVNSIVRTTHEMEARVKEIESCPFCGSEGTYGSHHNNPSQTIVWAAYCNNPACSWSNSPYWLSNKEEAIKRWNTRASQSSSPNPSLHTDAKHAPVNS